MKCLTEIDVQGNPQQVFEVYADKSREQTVGFVFDEQDAILLENALIARKKGKKEKQEKTEKKISDYCLIVGAYHDFQESVKQKIKDGWQPFGSPFTTAMCYCQAMVKYEKE